MINHDDTKRAAKFLFDRKYQLFLNFVAHTNQVKNAIHYLGDKALVVAGSVTMSELKYMDVGCGYGDKTLAVVRKLEKHKKVNTTALDPSQAMLSIFKSKIEDEAIELINSGWEDYQSVKKYDFITSIHAFYYIDDWSAAINKMITSRENNGSICIALRDVDDVCQFRDYFYQLAYGSHKKERNCQELCELLDKMNIKYEVEYVNSRLDVRDSIQKNELGIELLEFVLRKPYSEISDDIKIQLHDYLQANNHDGFMNQRDGYVWIG